MQIKLIVLRKQQNLSQKDVAKALNISIQTYRQKENGKRQFVSKEMFALSLLFNKPIEDIFLPTN